MKVGIYSDLHLTHHSVRSQNDILDNIRHHVELEKPDLMLNAGDCEVPCAFNGVPQVAVLGNHDWYGHKFQPGQGGTNVTLEDGTTITAVTLWTDYNRNDPVTKHVVNQALNDRNWIGGFSADVAYAEHLADVEFLRKYPSDIVLTHHCPSFKSVLPKWRKEGIFDLVNYGFASHLDELIEELQPKLWVHGHTHDSHDYTIGRTRVVCNPCGYPSELRGRPYAPVFVEI